MMDIKRGQKVWSISFFDKKTRSEASVNDELAQELNKVVIKNSKEGNCMLDLKVIFWQQIQLKWGSSSSFN